MAEPSLLWDTEEQGLPEKEPEPVGGSPELLPQLLAELLRELLTEAEVLDVAKELAL